MKRILVILALAASTWGMVGCDNSAKPAKDAEGKPVKAPDVPPNGV